MRGNIIKISYRCINTDCIFGYALIIIIKTDMICSIYLYLQTIAATLLFCFDNSLNCQKTERVIVWWCYVILL